jgi:hypothetical protein
VLSAVGERQVVEPTHYETVSDRAAWCLVVLLSDVLPDQSTCGWLDCATSYYVVQRHPATGWPPEGHRRRQGEVPRGLWVFHTASCRRSHSLQSRPKGPLVQVQAKTTERVTFDPPSESQN